MTSAPSRKNDPQAVRSRLLDCAARLIVDHGLSTLRLESVAREAGVSKGGLLHHYPGKEALISGLFDQVVEWFDCQVDAVLEADEASPARFSRAYLRVIASIDMTVPEEKRLAVLILMLSSDPQCSAQWSNWVEGRLRRHNLTDANPLARTLRLAADGLWLSDLGSGPDSQPAARREVLRFLEGLNAAHATDTNPDVRGR
ncbi:TetR/AcrR family transcriptional regulator [Hoeflea sp. YIM 152468]|uniref:TetR/AcrR family transcriptional regulator n=1 Tax=Hoeflea sp. YIM 152468 TaxID=3031759 RepID=UPI0023DB1745|nr:TetR/AcrR family transcriptional regulator [Hoeflea sp. YIM 152468]MDF1606896.1 TetR/AcrR family transcriptional regulator [Hoeflea sp. YIM 152468]